MHCHKILLQYSSTRCLVVDTPCNLLQGESEQTKTRKIRSSRKKQKRETTIASLAGGVADAIKRANETAAPPHSNRVRLRTKGNSSQAEEQQKKHTLQVAAAACGTSSIARFYLLVGLVPCCPACPLRPAFVNYTHSRKGCVRQYETSKAGSSSTHATRLLS